MNTERFTEQLRGVQLTPSQAAEIAAAAQARATLPEPEPEPKLVHYVNRDDDWTVCGEWGPYSGLVRTSIRDRTTCPLCRLRFTNPTDAELLLTLLAERQK